MNPIKRSPNFVRIVFVPLMVMLLSLSAYLVAPSTAFAASSLPPLPNPSIAIQQQFTSQYPIFQAGAGIVGKQLSHNLITSDPAAPTNASTRISTMPTISTLLAANVVAHALGMIPTREMIRDGLTITMKPKVIILGSEMLAEQQTAKSLTLENAKIEAEHQTVRLELDTKTRIEHLKIQEFVR